MNYQDHVLIEDIQANHGEEIANIIQTAGFTLDHLDYQLANFPSKMSEREEYLEREMMTMRDNLYRVLHPDEDQEKLFDVDNDEVPI